jgi:hypothetical protein
VPQSAELQPLPMPTPLPAANNGIVTIELTETRRLALLGPQTRLFEAARNALRERAVLTSTKFRFDDPLVVMNDLRKRVITREPGQYLRSEEVLTRREDDRDLVLTMRFVVDQASIDADLAAAGRQLQALGRPSISVQLDEEVRDATVKPMRITNASTLSAELTAALERSGWVISTAPRAATTLRLRGTAVFEMFNGDDFTGKGHALVPRAGYVFGEHRFERWKNPRAEWEDGGEDLREARHLSRSIQGGSCDVGSC